MCILRAKSKDVPYLNHMLVYLLCCAMVDHFVFYKIILLYNVKNKASLRYPQSMIFPTWSDPLSALCWYLLHAAGLPGGRLHPYHTWHIHRRLSSGEQSRLFTWLMGKWDFNAVTQPSSRGHICMSAILIRKPSVLSTRRRNVFTWLANMWQWLSFRLLLLFFL